MELLAAVLLLVAQAPHGPHEGRYGGAFATAASDTLHVEAVWSEQRRIRLLVTDAAGVPLPLDALRKITFTAIAGGSESPASLLELDSYFEARIPTLKLPATISARFKAASEAPEELLRFTFNDYSQQIDANPRPAPAEIPATLAGILGALEADRQAVQAIFAEQTDAGRMLPIEDRIRDRVLAIEPYIDRLPVEQRNQAQSAVTLVVRSCWLLHTVMDHGGGPQLDASVAQLNQALARLNTSVSGLAR